MRQTDAIWFISEGVVANDVAEGYLRLLPLDMGQTRGPVGFTTRIDTPLGLATIAFMQTVRETAERLRNAFD